MPIKQRGRRSAVVSVGRLALLGAMLGMLATAGCGDDRPPEPRVDAALCVKTITDACPVWFSCIPGTAITLFWELDKCTENAEAHCNTSAYWVDGTCKDVDDALMRQCEKEIAAPNCSDLPRSCEAVLGCYAFDYGKRHADAFR